MKKKGANETPPLFFFSQYFYISRPQKKIEKKKGAQKKREGGSFRATWFFPSILKLFIKILTNPPVGRGGEAVKNQTYVVPVNEKKGPLKI